MRKCCDLWWWLGRWGEKTEKVYTERKRNISVSRVDFG